LFPGLNWHVAELLRKEAERLQRLADPQTDPDVVQRLRQMAEENELLAAELEASNKPKNNKK
jgi:hypothetical protein